MSVKPDTNKRAKLLLGGLLVWAALATILLFNKTIVSGNETLKKGLAAARRAYLIPARRGTITDSDGRPLVWSETRAWIFLKRPPLSDAEGENARKALSRVFGKLNSQAFSSFPARRPLVENISPDDFRKIPPLLAKFPFLETVSREIRVKRPGILPETLAEIGAVKPENGKLKGVSGLEMERDAELRGRDGMFEVMVDKQGRWIPGTWMEILKPKPGNDLRLPLPGSAPTEDKQSVPKTKKYPKKTRPTACKKTSGGLSFRP